MKLFSIVLAIVLTCNVVAKDAPKHLGKSYREVKNSDDTASSVVAAGEGADSLNQRKFPSTRKLKKMKKKIMAMEDDGSQHVQRRAKSSKNGKRKKSKKKNIFGHDDDDSRMCSIEDFESVSTYEGGGTCEKTFEVTIGCNDEHTLCTFEEESMNDCEPENKSAYDTCVPFNPKKMLKYDKKNSQCVLGGKRGIPLKDQSNPDCDDVKYNVKIVMDVDDSSMLYLHFSENNGKTFYTGNEPRVATKDDLERTRRRKLCATCVDWGEGCDEDQYEIDQCESVGPPTPSPTPPPTQSGLNPLGKKCGFDYAWIVLAGCYKYAVPDSSCGSGWRVPDDCYDDSKPKGIPAHCGCSGGCICKKPDRLFPLSRDNWYCGNNKNAKCPDWI